MDTAKTVGSFIAYVDAAFIAGFALYFNRRLNALEEEFKKLQEGERQAITEGLNVISNTFSNRLQDLEARQTAMIKKEIKKINKAFIAESDRIDRQLEALIAAIGPEKVHVAPPTPPRRRAVVVEEDDEESSAMERAMLKVSKVRRGLLKKEKKEDSDDP